MKKSLYTFIDLFFNLNISGNAKIEIWKEMGGKF